MKIIFNQQQNSKLYASQRTHIHIIHILCTHTFSKFQVDLDALLLILYQNQTKSQWELIYNVEMCGMNNILSSRFSFFSFLFFFFALVSAIFSIPHKLHLLFAAYLMNNDNRILHSSSLFFFYLCVDVETESRISNMHLQSTCLSTYINNEKKMREKNIAFIVVKVVLLG